MYHDFHEKHGGEYGPCNGKGIMSYDEFPMEWSNCSVSDFAEAYNSNNWGKTCLKGKHYSN